MEENNLNKCRVCLIKTETCVSLFESKNNSKYIDLIKEYTGMEVEEGDNLPTNICKGCVSDLLIVVKFISKYRLSNEKLQEAVDLNVPFYKVLSNFIKEEDEDDDDAPLSEVKASMQSAAPPQQDIKEEPPDSEFNDDYLYLDKNSDDEEKHNTDPKYTILRSNKHGLKKNMVQCLTCGLLVQNKSAFIVHYRKHSGEKPCKCPHCDKRFTQMGTLSEHMRRHHPQAALPTKSSRCKRSQRTNELRYTCHTCGKQFLKTNYLTVHLRVHTEEKPYQCSSCPKAFRRCIDFIQHRRIHTGERPYACHICGKTFVSHTPLKRHLNVHSDERNFKCNICNTAVKSSDSLKKHILVLHSSERQNVCNICGAAFALKYNLKTHIKSKHSELSGSCDICKKTFSNLPKHLCTHSGERPFACTLCSKRFIRQKGLSAHLARHQGEADEFVCTFENCDAAFPKQCKLDLHILKSHTNHMPHVCQHCSKGFYRLPHLRRHLKTCNVPVKYEIYPESKVIFPVIDNKLF